MDNKSQKWVVGIAFSSFTVIGFGAGLLGVAWPSMRDSFGVSLDAVGVLFLLSTVGALAVSLYSGPIIQAIGLGPLLLIGCLIGGLGLLGMALSPAWWVMVGSGMVSNVGSAGLIVGLNTYFAMAQSARLMNWLQACFGLGATVSPTVMSSIIESGHSWRWGYGLIVIALFALAVGFGATLKHWRFLPQTSAEADAPTQKRASETLRLPAVWLSLLLFFAFTGLEGSVAQWPYTLFTEGRSVDPGTAGLWVSVFWACMTGGRIFFGIVVERVGTVPLIRATMAGVILGTVLIWANVSHTLNFLGLALLGLMTSPAFPVLTSSTPERVGSAHAPNAIGYQLASGRLGLAAIPALGGVLAAAFGLEIIAPFLVVMAIVDIIFYEATVFERSRRYALQPIQK